MTCLLLLTLFVFITPIYTVFTYNATDDMALLFETTGCDSQCGFNASEFSLDTIDLWPVNCSTVCAILKFTSSSNNIPFEKLKSTFQNLNSLRGVLRIENTTLTNFSFFGNITLISNINKNVLSISNNPKLTDISVLFTITNIYINYPVQIMNNPKLDVFPLCVGENFLDFDRFYIVNNMKDCGCTGSIINNANIFAYKNCTSIFGPTEISNATDASMFSALSDVRNITGPISIKNTNFQNLSFFSKMERMKGDDSIVNLDIHSNPNMTRLGFESLMDLYNIEDWFRVNIQDVHPDFCLTMEEMQTFTTFNTKYVKLEAKYCNITTRKDGQKTCRFESMSALANDCVHIMGNVVVSSGDEHHTGKLSKVIRIYGSLSITNTTLKNLEFLGNLINVAVLNDTSPAILLDSNPDLFDISLLSMRFPYTSGPNAVVVQNNAPNIFPNPYQCHNYQNAVGAYVLYNRAECDWVLSDGDYTEIDTGGSSQFSEKKAHQNCGVFAILICALLSFVNI
ncbi:hypothetical protein GCK72_025808 [Caenorhabditis remanei]|uniref:Receptor L-domain domain-containing protein n=1 Tax=Caenorhabditis remanei TaxID=31234 RepID=A0A6A5G3P2_CAERE|nr:hypothetical protein GCK72_025808 [Caenorhabditis remanei]KAF1749341.1 hypothetical protein GCK72_025808 [Caenorhabditis remanei]